MLRNFNLNENDLVKIGHRVNQDYKNIGKVLKIKDNLNICKIIFYNQNNELQEAWFHLFTGSTVTLPAKGEKFAKEIPFTDDNAYLLLLEPILPFELDPKADICYDKSKTYHPFNTNFEKPKKTKKTKKIE